MEGLMVETMLSYTAIEEIDIPETVAYIGHRAFSDTKLKEVVLPKNLISIEKPRTLCGLCLYSVLFLEVRICGQLLRYSIRKNRSGRKGRCDFMYDWNKDGKIDMVDHWITHQIINYEKEKSANKDNNTSYNTNYYPVKDDTPKGTKEKGPSLMTIILIDIALFALLYLMNGL